MTAKQLGALGMLARLARDFGPFLHTPITVEQAGEIVKHRLETRAERFLLMVKQMIYSHARSPYLRLLRAAGCDYGDLKALVVQEGVEGALSRLADTGVYVTFDEFKGRKAAVRGSERFDFAEEDFDNPHVSSHYEVRSGGSRGPGTSVKVNLSFVSDLAVNTALAFHSHGLTRHDHVIWLIAGVTPMLIYAKLARPPIAWFYPVRRLPFQIWAGSRYLAAWGRLASSPLPTPAFLDLMDAGEMAVRLAAWVRRGKLLCVTTYASSAVRIADAAKARGIALEGVCFITLGEPFTEAKQRIIAASGGRVLVRYGITEAGNIGYNCGTPQWPDDIHLFYDCYGLIQRRRSVGTSDLGVDAFLFTSLRRSAPKILLNVESGDYGIVERKGCGCELGALGLTTHLRRIRSFEKLSSEGMTFVQTNLLWILEEVLPARFGGTSADYQVLEEEEEGILRLSLTVSPTIGPVDEARVRETLLDELGKDGAFARMGARMWRRAETVRVRRQWPVATRAGKILPFHLRERKGN